MWAELAVIATGVVIVVGGMSSGSYWIRLPEKEDEA